MPILAEEWKGLKKVAIHVFIEAKHREMLDVVGLFGGEMDNRADVVREAIEDWLAEHWAKAAETTGEEALERRYGPAVPEVQVRDRMTREVMFLVHARGWAKAYKVDGEPWYQEMERAILEPEGQAEPVAAGAEKKATRQVREQR